MGKIRTSAAETVVPQNDGFEEAPQTPPEKLPISQRAMRRGADRYLEALNPEQREAVETLDGPLLVLTGAGTGKTRVAMGLIDVLLRARWAKRVLFLVDRIALRDQAIDAFRQLVFYDASVADIGTQLAVLAVFAVGVALAVPAFQRRDLRG